MPTNPVDSLLERRPDLSRVHDGLRTSVDLLATSFAAGGKLLICGNGGSAADSEHIVGELMKSFGQPRPVPSNVRTRLEAVAPENATYLADHLEDALPAISLVSQTSLASAIANDTAADMAFAQQVFGYGRPGDVLLGISTSGNARNVLHALQVARALDVRTIGLTGHDGGGMAPMCDAVIVAPGANTAEIQENHIAIYHAICLALEDRFFGPKR